MARRRHHRMLVAAIDLAGPEIGLDHATLRGRRRKQMNMHFVGTETRSALTDLRKIEGPRAVANTADGKHLAATRCVAAHEEEVCSRNLGAPEKAVDGMNVALTGSAAPEVEPLTGLKIDPKGRERRRSRAAGSDFCELNDTRSHETHSFPDHRTLTLTDGLENAERFKPKYGLISVILGHLG